MSEDKVTNRTTRKYFNMKHSVARNIIERCFEMLKGRWTIFRNTLFYLIQTYNRIIMAGGMLHNLFKRYNSGDPLEGHETNGENESDNGNKIENNNWITNMETFNI
ncbi:hypothetical protein L6164_008522 [Bauhinia variegata]|uniref:Uncharacterized protein n=1 Tax=Bauhinia variegata TaxID=167791 RepID=A0ACB9PIF5_BAUVA|nr:hypothetical protein L6164_008522 [Bauhinia variegata]